MFTRKIDCRLLKFWVLAAVLASLVQVQSLGAEPSGVSVSGDQTKPAVALTFDDGPSPVYTPKIMALLKKYEALATFFVLGSKAEACPRLIKAMLAAGHEVGNHTYSHVRLPAIAHPEGVQEMERTRLALDLLGVPPFPKIFRPPYSDYDPWLAAYLRHTNQDLILWNVDSGDWRGLEAKAIADNVLSRVKNGAIIIFHDSDENCQADRTPTVEALKIILPALRQVGYRMVTVSEVLGRP